jgi:hypothetical protein
MIDVEPHKISSEGFPARRMRRAFDDKEAQRVPGHCPQIRRGFAQRRKLCGRVVAARRVSKRFAFSDDVLLSRGQVEEVWLPWSDRDRNFETEIATEREAQCLRTGDLKGFPSF